MKPISLGTAEVLNEALGLRRLVTATAVNRINMLHIRTNIHIGTA